MSKRSAQPAEIHFGNLRLDQAVFEVRCYNREVLIAHLPEFWEAVEADLKIPIKYEVLENGSACQISKSKQISVSQDKFAVAAIFPGKSLVEFIELSQQYYRTVTAFLRTERLDRVGFRLIYSVDFQNATDVAEAFLRLPFISVPEGLALSSTGIPLIPSYFLGWNDGTKNLVYRLKGNSSKISVNLPPQLSLLDEYPETIEKTYNQFVFDVDVFTTIPVSPNEFLTSEWLLQAYEVIKSDGVKFFGE